MPPSETGIDRERRADDRFERRQHQRHFDAERIDRQRLAAALRVDHLVVAAAAPGRRRLRSTSPQTMLSPSVEVPHTMLSPSSAVPQTMLSPSTRCPRRCCRSRRRRSRCPTRCCRRRRPCPRRCCRRRRRAPDDVVAAGACPRRCCRRRRRAPDDVVARSSRSVPHTMLSPSCPASWPRPTRCCCAHALAVGMMHAARQPVVAPDDLAAPDRCTGMRSPGCAVRVEPRQAHGAERVEEAGALRQRVVARILLRGVLQDRLDQVRRQRRIRLQHQRDRAG